MRRIIEVLFSVLFWVGAYYLSTQIFAVMTIEIENINGEAVRRVTYDKPILWSIRIGLVLKICFYYLNVYFFTKFYKKSGASVYLVILLLAICVFQLFEIIKVFQIFEDTHTESVRNAVGINLLQYIFLAILSLAHFILLKSREDELQTLHLLREKQAAELQVLKSQINPHFLFNALNNILSITNKERNDKASDAIAELSEMMRFLLYDAGQEQILLSKEIELIDHYIHLNQLRFDEGDAIDIHFTKEGEIALQKIEPMLLLPFVENAFKHGIQIFEPSYVHIAVHLNGNSLLFKVENSRHEKKIDPVLRDMNHSGIGIANVRKRLDMVYQGRYQLICREMEQKYIVELELSL